MTRISEALTDAPLTVGSSARTGFLVRYADDLKLGWALPLTGTGDIWPWALTVDSAGNIIVAGELSGTADFGGGPITSSANIDGFVASFDADGQHRYSFGLPTTGDGRGGHRL